MLDQAYLRMSSVSRSSDTGRERVIDVKEGIQIVEFFIMSTEFDKNISDWSYDCTDHKNGIEFFMR